MTAETHSATIGTTLKRGEAMARRILTSIGGLIAAGRREVVMNRRSRRYALVFVLVAAAMVATSSPAYATRKPPLGRCTMTPTETRSTIEVKIPDAADFCELVSRALAYELFNTPMIVTPGRLWHYPGAALSCRLRYRHTSDRIRIHNADAACQWFLRLAPGWHLEAVKGPLPVLSTTATPG